ncbi:nitrilase-related carbon-nitrogen hydrolase [Elusimicrobiota bacterium]
MNKSLNIALIQLDTLPDNKKANFNKTESLLESCFSKNPAADIIAVPEMFATGFIADSEKICEKANGETSNFLAGLARKHKAFVVGSYIETQDKEKPKNTAIIFDRDGREIFKYYKIHLFTYAGEHERISSGSDIPSVLIEGVAVSVMICYDLRFPELFRKAVKEHKTEVFIVPANWPEGRQKHWDKLLEARAIENQAYCCGINRVGKDERHAYTGGTAIVGPIDERTVAYNDETVVYGTLDLGRVAAWRRKFQALRDIKLI